MAQIFVDIHSDNNVIRKLAAYVILGINCDGRKEVLSIQVGENESAKEPLNNSAARWRLNFSHLLLAEISIYLQ